MAYCFFIKYYKSYKLDDIRELEPKQFDYMYAAIDKMETDNTQPDYSELGKHFLKGKELEKKATNE